MSSIDNRRHPRIEVVLKVTYSSREALLSDYTHNASAGGLFIATDKEFSNGEELTLELSFPGLLAPVACRGVVRWRRPESQVDEDNPSGVGIEFAFRSTEEERPVRELFAKLSMAAESAAQVKESGTTAPSPELFRALLVEDNPLIREMLMFAVRKFHRSLDGTGKALDLAEAENGLEACQLLEEHPFDIAIVDTIMPVMDGFRLVDWIRKSQKHADLPVIMVTTGDQDERKEAEAVGSDLVVNKPLVLNKLLHSIRQLLDIAAAGKEG